MEAHEVYICLQFTTGWGKGSDNQEPVLKPLVKKHLEEQYGLTPLPSDNPGVVAVAMEGILRPPHNKCWADDDC